MINFSKILISYILTNLAYTTIFAQGIQIPKGINYKYNSNEINNKAIEVIKREFSENANYDIYSEPFYCGPHLWNILKEIPDLSKIEGGNVTIEVPISEGKQLTKKFLPAKLIQREKDFKIFWSALLINLSTDQYIIRKLSKEELEYYWGVIFYDIEEPIFIIETPKFKMLIDLTNEMKIQWIDLV